MSLPSSSMSLPFAGFLLIAGVLPGTASAACPAGYTTCDAGTGTNICTQATSTRIDCDTSLHGYTAPGNTEAWAVTPSAGKFRAWGNDENGAQWCCEYDVDQGLVLYLDGTPQADDFDLNFGALHLASATAYVDTHGGDDTLSASNQVSCSSNLYGEDGADSFFGFDGFDYMELGTGNDTVVAGAGDDTIIDIGGDDIIRAGDGNDYIDAQGGYDQVKGDLGNDYILGGNENDRICGGPGDDHSDGGDGNDSLWGGDGVDDEYGGSGSDSCELNSDGGVRSSCTQATTACSW